MLAASMTTVGNLKFIALTSLIRQRNASWQGRWEDDLLLVLPLMVFLDRKFCVVVPLSFFNRLRFR